MQTLEGLLFVVAFLTPSAWYQEKREKEKKERIKCTAAFLTQPLTSNLGPLETKLESVMVSQLAAIYNVAAAIRRRQNGWHDEDKPLVLLFLGSSGVGKTMLAKVRNKRLHPFLTVLSSVSPNMLLKIMSTDSFESVSIH